MVYQEDLRETLKLTGGDDRIQLIVEAITLRDKNSHTSNSCMQLVSRFGDRSLPYIRRAAERALEDQQELDLWRISGSLAFVRSDRATATILQLYDFGNPQVRSGAEYALVHKPFRPKAKRAYLDMVRRRSRISEAAAACVEFEWREAIPFLRAAIDRPDSLFVLRDALRACRTLEGNPVSAERLLMTNLDGNDPASQKKIDDAIRLLIDSKDAEAADTSALMLAMRIGKGSFAWVNDRGLAILRSRPREATLAFITRIRAGMPRYQQERLNKVLKNITGRNQAAAPRTIGQPRANPFAPSTVPLGADLPPDPFQRRRVITPTMVGVPGTGWQIATTPVTNAQYGQFLEATNRKWPVVADLPDTDGRDRGYPWKHLLGSADGFAEGRGNHPVALVSREEALAYCRWLGSRIGGEFTLAPNEVYAAAVRGSRGVSVGRDEMKRLGRAETLDGTNRMWFPLARVDAYPQYQSDLKVLVQGQSFYELTKKGLSQPNAWWADSSRPFLFEQHGPANRLCVVGFRVARDMDRRANTAPGDTTWVNAVSEPSDRGTQHFAYQKVRDRRTRNEDQFRHWRMWHRDDIRELDEQFDAAGKVRVSYSPRDENLLMFRSRQLNDLDRIWIERVERDGKQFTITAHRAIWGGVYTRNISYFDVFAVRIGKLPAGDYRAKLIIKPLTFMKYDENRWPIGERPSRAERPTELNVDFRIAGLTIPGEGFPGRPDDPAPVVPSAPDLAPTVPRGQPRAAIKSARPAPAWGKAVNGLQAGLICDAPPEGFEPGHVRVGEFLSVQLTVKNVSNRMISFTSGAPSFRVPDLHDLTGRKMKIMIPPWDGPASFATHRLKPGESTTLPVRRCTIAPRVPIYNADGSHI